MFNMVNSFITTSTPILFNVINPSPSAFVGVSIKAQAAGSVTGALVLATTGVSQALSTLQLSYFIATPRTNN